MQDKLKVTQKCILTLGGKDILYRTNGKSFTTALRYKSIVYTIGEIVLYIFFIPVYNNGRCPIVKTCSDVTFYLSSGYSTSKIQNLTNTDIFCWK